jgi:murein DD-endopeptidase MepM/ murein hydrolase activator NlpD
MFRFLIILFIPLALFSSQVKNFRWSDGDSYLTFLEKLHLPTKPLYYNLDADDQKLTEEIRSGVNCQMLESPKKEIQQILIPINDDLQIHIIKNKNDLTFEVIPIIHETKRESLTIVIDSSPYNDIIKVTKSKKLAKIFVAAFKNSLNFKNVHKGDKLVMVYDRMYRLGQPFSMPTLNVCMMQIGDKQHFVYRFKDDQYFDESGSELEAFLLAAPVRNARISSVFTMMRWHPILHKFRAHLGVDYAARPGTPILAAGNGTVNFCGVTNGYGNLTKVSHVGGYVTLYAHQKAFGRGIHKGSVVKQGQVIGFVGTSGLSTGPHLHFGLYKDGRAINPQSVVRVAASKLAGKEKKTFDRMKASVNKIVNQELKQATVPKTFLKLEPTCYADANGKQKSDTQKNDASSEDDSDN